MEKTEVEQNIQKNIRKKRSVYRFKTEEERKTARREARKKYRHSAKGKEQLKREWEKSMGGRKDAPLNNSLLKIDINLFN